MNALSAIGLALLLIGTTPRLVFANMGPSGDPLVTPAWLLILLAIFAWLPLEGYVKRRHLRAAPRLLMTALAVLGAIVGSLLMFVFLFFISINYLRSGWSIRVAVTLVGLVFGGIALCRAGQLLRWGWRARHTAAVPPDLMALTPWRLLFNGGVLSLLAAYLAGFMIMYSLDPYQDDFYIQILLLHMLVLFLVFHFLILP